MKFKTLTFYLFQNQAINNNGPRLLLTFENVKSVKKALEMMEMMGN